jgi:hypothetical protein
MYTHISKGLTLGQALTRRLFRNITGIPGYCIDVILSYLWFDEGYWRGRIYYFDGVSESVFRGIFGWIGDIIGVFLGGLGGTLIGFTLFFPDRVILAFIGIYNFIENSIHDFACMVGNRPFFASFNPIRDPQTYFSKSGNIAMGTLGVILGLITYSIPKFLEFIFPIGHSISDISWKLGAWIGKWLGKGIALTIYPIIHLIGKSIDVYGFLRNAIRTTTAFIYAQTNQVLYQTEDGCCYVNNVHSNEFRERVNNFKRKNDTTTILFGQLIHAAPTTADVKQHTENLLECPITHSEFTDPVMDRQGHTFEKSAINTWLQTHHNCPIGREELREADLIPNRVLKAVIESQLLKNGNNGP